MGPTMANAYHPTHPPLGIPDTGRAVVAWNFCTQRPINQMACACHCAHRHDIHGHLFVGDAVLGVRLVIPRLAGLVAGLRLHGMATGQAAIA